jgi:hypothetical protein
LLDEDGSFFALDIGETILERFEVIAEDDSLIDVSLSELKDVYSCALESQLVDEVLA